MFYGKGSEQPLFLLRKMIVSSSEAERRAALTADKIAETAEFFSFGFNDLAQMTFGFSRDNIGGFMLDYLKNEDATPRPGPNPRPPRRSVSSSIPASSWARRHDTA